jgi:hypothetical protein
MTTYDENGVWAAIHNTTTDQIGTTQIGGPSTKTLPTLQHDSNYIMSHVFDITTNTIRVVVV